jgi:hypothetical protein
MVIIPHPPYPPDFAPCKFTLFPKLKMKLKGRHFETVSAIKWEMQAVLHSIKVLPWWKKQCEHCMHSQGDYLKEMAAKIE